MLISIYLPLLDSIKHINNVATLSTCSNTTNDSFEGEQCKLEEEGAIRMIVKDVLNKIGEVNVEEEEDESDEYNEEESDDDLMSIGNEEGIGDDIPFMDDPLKEDKENMVQRYNMEILEEPQEDNSPEDKDMAAIEHGELREGSSEDLEEDGEEDSNSEQEEEEVSVEEMVDGSEIDQDVLEDMDDFYREFPELREFYQLITKTGEGE